MSIKSCIDDIESSRDKIRAKLIELGLAQTSDNLAKLATSVETITKRNAVSIDVKEGETYTIPKGYHNGSGTVSGVAGGGNYKLKEFPDAIEPTKSQQNIVPDDGYYGIKSITIGAIPADYQNVSAVNVQPGEVLANKIYVAKDGTPTAGTMNNNGAMSRTLDVTTTSCTIPKGFHSGTGTVSIVLESQKVTPTKSVQTVEPEPGNVLSIVTVNPIPDQYQKVTNVTAKSANVLDGDVFVDSSGTEVRGTMPKNGAITATIDGLTTSSYTIPVGYHNGSGTITLTDDIETALAAI